MIQLFDFISDYLFNRSCIFCKKSHTKKIIPYICNTCLMMFNPVLSSICDRCSHPLPDSGKCISCNKLEKIYYDSYQFLQYYTDYFKKIIMMLKIKEKFIIMNLFFRLIIMKSLIPKNSLITVVPDSLIRRIKKGRSGLHYLLRLFKNDGYQTNRLIYRRKWLSNKNQKKRYADERVHSIGNLFYLPKKNRNRFTGTIYLIDDIYTSGATLNYGAKLLKEAGFNQVHIISFFRTVMLQD